METTGLIEGVNKARDEAGALWRQAAKARGAERVELMLTGLMRHVCVLDGELLKLRKELRTRNGGEND